jgi:O-antigen ligase
MQAVLTTGWMEGQAQDGYLDVLLQLGGVGLVSLIWIFLRAFRQAASRIEGRIADASVRFAIVLLPLILVENIGESSFLLPLGLPWFYSLIALMTLNFSPSHLEAA